MFDESKHPRASDGKFTDGNSGNDGYSESVNERIKWAKENGVDLPLDADGSVDDLKLQEMYDSQTIHLPDEILPRSLSAKWANEDIKMPDGTIAHFVEGSKLHHKEVFAGKGTKTPIRDVERLVTTYGGKAEEWQKIKGIGTIVLDNGEQEEVEIHWYEEPSVGRHEIKYKTGRNI